jgi:phospho-N-acetylmuramoyl-pentapeptide-transferase
MGGALILFSLTVATLLFANLTNRYVWSVLLVTLSFGAIGFWDDYLKISKRNSKGLAGRKDLHLSLPFVPTKYFEPSLGWAYLPFMVFLILATSHAVNLTDGLDGLAIGPTIVSAMTFLILAYVAGTTIGGFSIAAYLRIPVIPGAAELGVFCSALIGAGIAFLWYNTYPASVFMGDVGSLALGGALGTLAVLTKNEIASAILHGVFLVETVSVIVQVTSYRYTGRRVFKMAPIHHHFELKGWAEPKIIVRFWIMSIMLALVALASLKLR